MLHSLWPYWLQHARLPCPSPIPGACSNSYPSSRWCHPTISSSIIHFSSWLQSFPELRSLLRSQFFTCLFGFPLIRLDFPGGSDGKVSAYNVGGLGLIPGSGRSPGEGNGNPLQYSCLKNPMNRGAWCAAVHGVVKSRTQLSDFTLIR